MTDFPAPYPADTPAIPPTPSKWPSWTRELAIAAIALSLIFVGVSAFKSLRHGAPAAVTQPAKSPKEVLSGLLADYISLTRKAPSLKGTERDEAKKQAAALVVKIREAMVKVPEAEWPPETKRFKK